ncbi:MAG: outer membrane lipoprotein [Planctomycetota bacterium]|jgi:outer membrane lipoprotein SlyB
MKSVIAVLLCVAIVGCGGPSSHSSNTISRSQAGRAQTVQDGEVLYVRSVTIEGSSSPVGAIAGGALGYVIGNNIGGGRGRDVARVGGTIGGAAAGHAVQRNVTQEQALEITVQLDNGQIISIVQAADEPFNDGCAAATGWNRQSHSVTLKTVFKGCGIQSPTERIPLFEAIHVLTVQDPPSRVGTPCLCGAFLPSKMGLKYDCKALSMRYNTRSEKKVKTKKRAMGPKNAV